MIKEPRNLSRAVASTRQIVLGSPARGRFARARYLLTHLPDLVAAAGVLRKLPRLTASLSTSPEGELIRRVLRRRTIWGLPVARLGWSVLPIPERPEDYLRGRSRQALRTNIARARAAGVVVQPSGCDRVLRLHAPDGSLQADQLEGLPGLRTCSLRMSATLEDRTVAQALVAVDGEWALLAWSMSEVDPTPEVSAARYLLHAEVVHACSSRGVRYLTANTPWRLPEGIYYYQSLLGFLPFSVRVARWRRGGR